MKKTMRIFLALGACLVAAIIAGCGSSDSVGSDNVAMIAGNPISLQAYKHWTYVAQKSNAAQEQGEPVILPGTPPDFDSCVADLRKGIASVAKDPTKTLRTDCATLFTGLNKTVMGFLIEAYWYQALAAKQGIHVTPAEIASTYKAEAKATFPTASAYAAFAQETGETKADFLFHVRIESLFQKLLTRYSPAVTTAAIDAYYTKNAAEFRTAETRSIKLIQTTSQSAIMAAQAALKSGQSWATVAAKYSTNTQSKANGGVIQNLAMNQEEAAVNKVIFASPVNQLKGPIKGTFGYYLVEVTQITPAVTTSLAKATPEIKEFLAQQNQTSAQTKINAAAKKLYGSRTLCASLYTMSDCAGYKAPKTTTSTTAAG